MGEAFLALQNLTVRYGPVTALDRLTATVPRGGVALLGPNGAGKSTLLKVLLGWRAPASGAVRVYGLCPLRQGPRLRARLGYVPEADAWLPGLTGVGSVALLGRLSGLSRRAALHRAHDVLDFVGLGEARYRRGETYSTGMRQRLKLAQALVHDPPALLLDEPTTGLDPRGRREMLMLLRTLVRAGKDLLLTTHLLEDAEAVAEEVLVLRAGRLLKQGPTRELVPPAGRTFAVRTGAAARLAAALARHRLDVQADADGAVRVHLPPGTGPELILRTAREAEVPIWRLEEEQPALAEAFFRILEEA